jgi:hypothetical protein
MKMILRDIHFPIREATISGSLFHPDYIRSAKYLNPGLDWEIIVQTEEQPIDEDFFADPRMSCGEFSLPLRRWLDLEGQTVHSAAGNQPGAPVAFSYFGTHEAIPSSTLKFVKRMGNKFLIHWEGTCEPMFEEPYKKNVPFLIQTEATFKEISVQAIPRDTDATTLERLSKYIDPADFIQHPLEKSDYDDSVENRYGIFEPLLHWFFPRRRTGSRYRYSRFEPRV